PEAAREGPRDLRVADRHGLPPRAAVAVSLPQSRLETQDHALQRMETHDSLGRGLGRALAGRLAEPMSSDRILVIAHGHPAHSKGGAEVAAYHMFKELRGRGIDAMFLARTDGPSHGGSAFSTYGSDRELLFHTGMSDF